jgi:hypothetical protein
VGLYRNTERGDVVKIEREGNALRLGDGTELVALTSKRFTDSDGLVIEFEGPDGGTMDEGSGTVVMIERVATAQPTAAELDSVFPLTPLYAGAFDSELGTIIFRRDGAGRPVEFSVVRERVWDLRFRRAPGLGQPR